MTTKHSPLRVLKGQADQVAKMLKMAERGEDLGPKGFKMMEARRNHPDVRFAVIMDDKTLLITMTWKQIEESSEVGISEYVLREMRERRSDQ